MKAVAQIAVAIAPVLLAGVFPFLRVLRGGRLRGAFVMCWGLLILWFFVFSMVIPLVAFQIDRDFGRTVSNWVPEGPGVVAMAFFGWLYAGITVLFALLVRRVFRSPKSCVSQPRTDEGNVPTSGSAARCGDSGDTKQPPTLS